LTHGTSTLWAEIPSWAADRSACANAAYKTIFYCDGPVKVFDLKADPLEMKDLSASTAGKAVANKHRKHLREYLDRIELCQPRGSKEKQKPYEMYLDYYRTVRKVA